MMKKRHISGLLLIQFVIIIPSSLGLYRIGVGIADCTGPAAEVVFMGYAKPSQKGCGIHLRQFSRAFIIDDGVNRVAFVSVDAAMMAHGVLEAVLTRLNKEYNNTYTESNVVLSGTHTHSSPGGFLMHFLYDIPTFGFVKETFDALVNGITKSIIRAHERMVTGRIYSSSGELLGANINRSPTSYLLNPEAERAKYKYNVDKEMFQLKFIKSSDSSLIGSISWFAVHPTSMNNTNCFISSDNVGYASILLEKSINNNTLLGKGPFVGAFASTNLGDVSPNTRGARCINTGEECDLESSTCGGSAQYCIASGPGRDMFESTKIVAEMLYVKAKMLLEASNSEVTGAVNYIQKFVDMPTESATFTLPDGTSEQVHGCLPAMGYSFAAGTTDGPGEFDFTQATRSANSYWNTIRDLLFKPTAEDIACQYPKPILINTGRISVPYEWQPRIVSTQLLQLGNVVVAAVPGEFTTMSGRRLRAAVRDGFGGSDKTQVVIAGLSNVYTSYITTPEEYQKQRYEGASTIFGPHTLTIYLKIYRDLAKALVSRERRNSGPVPPHFSNKLVSLLPGVVFDTAGLTRHFGDCVLQPPKIVNRGMTVKAKFISGHPRNNMMQESTFLTIEKLIGSRWNVVATDADWETKFIWKRTASLLGGSEAIILWETTSTTPTGTYRIRHFGYCKPIFGGMYPYVGSTHEFELE